METLRLLSTKDNSDEELIATLARQLEATHEADAFEGFEKWLLVTLNEVGRRCVEQRLQRCANAFGERAIVDEQVYRKHQPGSARYFTLFGAVQIRRSTYRRVGVHNGETIVPLDGVATLAYNTTPALAFCIAQGVAKAPVRNVEQDLKAAHRVPPSVATIDRIARVLGGLVDDDVAEIEPQLRAVEALPVGAKAVNIGLDRTTIPMEERAKKRKCVVKYRMAYVGTFAVSDQHGTTLVARRYAVPSHQGPQRIIERIRADLEHALAQDPKLNVGVVQDGAAELWALMWEMLRSLKLRDYRQTIDRFHLMEKLALCLSLIFPRDERKRAGILARWNRSLDQNDRAILHIRKWIYREQRHVTGRRHEELSKTIGCYFVNPSYFRYASLAPLGLQQGSGVTEGACKSLVTIRAKRSGQRWRPEGIRAVMALRSLLNSDRFRPFWTIFIQRFHFECAAA